MGNDNQQPAWCELLYHAKASELMLYGRALGLSHAEAEDVLQETFLVLMERADAPANPAHYAVRTYRNRALNYKRTLWRRLTREFESRGWFEPSPSVTAPELAAMAALASLPPDQREVIVLKVWHRLTFDEIAALLDIPANTAAGRYRYGIQRLRRVLKGINTDEYESRCGCGDAIALLDPAAPVRPA